MRRVRGRGGFARPTALLFLLASCCAPLGQAAAASFAVNDSHDAADTAPGDGTCASMAGVCTVRAAVQEANALPGADVIVLPAGSYLIGIPGRDEDAAATGDLDVIGDVELVGAGASASILDGGGLDGVIEVLGGDVTIRGLTVRGGDAGGGISSDCSGDCPTGIRVLDSAVRDNDGVGIFAVAELMVAGTTVADNGGVGIVPLRVLSLADSTVSGNLRGIGGCCTFIEVVRSTIRDNGLGASAPGCGGGISHASGGLQLTESVVSANRAESGAGVCVIGLASRLDVVNSVVKANVATVGSGGGVQCEGGCDVSLMGSTVARNIAPGDGGGVFVQFAAVEAREATLSGNRAGGSGGGLFTNGVAYLEDTTIAGNVADTNADGMGDGGGVFNCAGCVGGVLEARSTLIADNLDEGGEAPDCSGPLTSLGYDLIEDTAGCSVNGSQTGLRVGVDPALGPLADNGGPTPTHALPSMSVAVDAGPVSCGGTDQRGVTRPQGATCDIGAYELACGNGVQCVDGPLMVTLVRIAPDRVTKDADTGRIRIIGILPTAPPMDYLDPAAGMTVRVRDAGGLDQTVTWAGAECKLGRRGAITCQGGDGRRSHWQPLRQTPGSFEFVVVVRALDVLAPLTPGVTVGVEYGAGRYRVGQMDTCDTSRRDVLRCPPEGGRGDLAPATRTR